MTNKGYIAIMYTCLQQVQVLKGFQMRHVLSILVRNQSGVLVRVASMFSRREFNIDSLSVGVTETAEFSRITVVVQGDEELVDQMMKQLEKLPDVVEVQALQPGTSIQA